MIEATDYQEILFEVKDDVAWITINRPEVMNAFREQTLDELIHAVRSTPDYWIGNLAKHQGSTCSAEQM